MAYRKNIKGDSNQANEEFSHNRITVVMGSSGVILALFLIVLVSSAIGWMIVREGTLFSILIVGTFCALFAGGAAYGANLLLREISKTHTQMRANKLLARTIVSGEIVSYLDDEDEWTHLSAIHEQAKIMPQLPMKAESKEPLPSEASVILEMHRQGIGFKTIAESTMWTEYAVRKLCNQIDGK